MVQPHRQAGGGQEGPSRDWLRTKCSEFRTFVENRLCCEHPGKIDHIMLAEVIGDKLVEIAQVRFHVGRELSEALDASRVGDEDDGGVMAVEPPLAVSVRFFGRHRSAALRDGVIQHK